MPLLKGKPYPLIKPVFRKNGNTDSAVFVIDHTNEKFLSKEYPFYVRSCLVLFFFIVDHEMDSHAENKNPSRKKCVIN